MESYASASRSDEKHSDFTRFIVHPHSHLGHFEYRRDRLRRRLHTVGVRWVGARVGVAEFRRIHGLDYGCLLDIRHFHGLLNGFPQRGHRRVEAVENRSCLHEAGANALLRLGKSTRATRISRTGVLHDQ